MRTILVLAFLQYCLCTLYTMHVLWNAVKLSRRHCHESCTHTGHYSEQVSSTPHTRNGLRGDIFNTIFFSPISQFRFPIRSYAHNCILPSTPWSSKWSHFLRFPHPSIDIIIQCKNTYITLILRGSALSKFPSKLFTWLKTYFTVFFFFFSRHHNLSGFRPAQLSLSILGRKVLQSAVASGTSNPQLGGELGI
jgi:hypothetical protein